MHIQPAGFIRIARPGPNFKDSAAALPELFGSSQELVSIVELPERVAHRVMLYSTADSIYALSTTEPARLNANDSELQNPDMHIAGSSGHSACLAGGGRLLRCRARHQCTPVLARMAFAWCHWQVSP